jgi:hypothetical protein
MDRISYGMNDDDHCGYQSHDAEKREVLAKPRRTSRHRGNPNVNFGDVNYFQLYQNPFYELRVYICLLGGAKTKGKKATKKRKKQRTGPGKAMVVYWAIRQSVSSLSVMLSIGIMAYRSVEGRFLLDVVIEQSAAVFKVLAGEDEASLVGGRWDCAKQLGNTSIHASKLILTGHRYDLRC